MCQLRPKAESENPYAASFALSLMEIPFWIVFGICAALGMVHWLAGVASAIVISAAFLVWCRSNQRYECVVCDRRFGHFETRKLKDAGIKTHRP